MTSHDNPSPGDRRIQNAVSDALESERQGLATRLRDTVISQASLIQAQVNSYQATAHPQSQMAFSVVSSLMQQLMQQVYHLESTLNPTTLESLGFAVALESFVSQQRRITGANFTLNILPGKKRLPLHIELALYRFLQNIVDDALPRRSSSQISIGFQHMGDTFTLSILENGEYILPEAKFSRERLHSLGAEIQYRKSRYGGLETTVMLTIVSPVRLTKRETEVIRLLAEGLSNKEIAFQLDVKPRTIKFHLDNIYSKLDVNTRTEAAIYALQHGLTG